MHQGNLKRESYKIIERSDAKWTKADDLTVRHTAFVCFDDLLNAAGGYSPSLDCSNRERAELCELYDAAQRARGNSRRTHIYHSKRETHANI